MSLQNNNRSSSNTPLSSVNEEVNNNNNNQIEKDIIYVIKLNNVRFSKVREKIQERSFTINDGLKMNRKEDINIVNPQLARNLDLNYCMDVIVDVVLKTYKKEKILNKETNEIIINRILIDSLIVKNYCYHELLVCVGSKYCETHESNNVQFDKIKKFYNQNEDPYDYGGYYIVRGNEKVIISQEKMKDNAIYIMNTKNKLKKSTINKKHKNSQDIKFGMNLITAEIRCLNQDFPFKNPLLVELKFSYSKEYDDCSFKVHLKYINEEFPLGTLIRALIPEKIIDHDLYLILTLGKKKYDNYIISTIKEYSSVENQDEALHYIGIRGTPKDFNKESTKWYAKKYILNDFLCHIPTDKPKEKLVHIGWMVRKLLDVLLKTSSYDNRDKYPNKKSYPNGMLLSVLYDKIYKKHIVEVKNNLRKSIEKIYKGKKSDLNSINLDNILMGKNISALIKYSISTGSWSIKGSYGLTGVAVPLMRQTGNNNIISQLVQDNIPLGNQGKTADPRQLQVEHIGFNGPDSHEGDNLGLKKSNALTSLYTSYSKCSELYEMIFKDYLGIKTISESEFSELYNTNFLIFNGYIFGYIPKNTTLLETFNKLKQLKNKMIISYQTGIILNVEENYIHVKTDGGRKIRPLLKVNPDTNELLLPKKRMKTFNKLNHFSFKDDNFFQLVYEGYIEFLDVEEQTYAMISYSIENLKIEKEKMKNIFNKQNILNKEGIINDTNFFIRYHYCEIHPINILDLNTSIIPFGNNNPSSRASHQSSSHSKQAEGIPGLNFRQRFDNVQHILCYPQKPLIMTRTSTLAYQDILPAGQNALVGIFGTSGSPGYTMDDAISINQQAIDRGFMRSIECKSFFIKEKNFTELIGLPKMELIEKIYSNNQDYLKKIKNLDEDGIIKKGRYVTDGDILVFKYSILKNLKGDKKTKENKTMELYTIKDLSLICRGISGFIDDTIIFFDEENSILSSKKEGKPNSSKLKTVKIKIRIIHIPEVGDKFCLTPDHQVLTNFGWKYYYQLNNEDKIATLKNNNELVYDDLQQIYEFNHKGQMYNIETNQVNLLVTLNHNMWVKLENEEKYQLIKAKNIINKHCKYMKTVKFLNKDIEYKEQYGLGNKIFNFNYWLEFFALLINYNCKIKELKNNSSSSFIGWEINYLFIHYEKNQKLQNLINDLHFQIQYDINNNNDINIIIKSDEYKNMFNNDILFLLKGFKNDKNYFPSWVWNLSRIQSIKLLNNILYSNNKIIKTNNTVSYFTKIEKLINNLQILCIHAGLTSNIILIKNKNELSSSFNFKKKFTYQITIFFNVNEYNTKFEKNFINKQKIIDYNGKVFCIEVPSHIFFIRRNGIVTITGNSSRHGQKGITGSIINSWDMPFTKDGITPDIIIDPSCCPSRMTIGQILEAFLGKISCLKGNSGDGTMFDNIKNHSIKNLIQKYSECKKDLGDSHGNEIMYHGTTGQMIKRPMFIGPVFYQRNMHKIGRKIHCRTAFGPRYTQTKQPVEGRSRDGGLRFGEMERDVLIAYGSSAIIRERLCTLSDEFHYVLCKKCKSFATTIAKTDEERAYPNYDEIELFCERCNSGKDCKVIILPAACKKLFNDLNCDGLGTYFK